MVLHLRCGDDILDALARAGIPGTRAQWGDPLCEGPLAPWEDDAERRTERARWIAGRYGEEKAVVVERLAAADRTLETAADADEVVLWFEHDLFDQAILVFLLARLGRLAGERTRLICIDRFPGVVDFAGLGQLSPEQLASLYPFREPVGTAQFEAAARVWGGFCGGDPLALLEAADRAGATLPFVPAAVRRYLAELPSRRNGLSQTEMLALQAVAAGADTPRHAFVAAQRFEPAPWQGDLMFFATLRELCLGPVPLLTHGGGRLVQASDGTFAATRLELTAQGRGVLTGRSDWCALAPASRRHGAILIEGAHPAWRWDERAGAPVRAP